MNPSLKKWERNDEIWLEVEPLLFSCSRGTLPRLTTFNPQLADVKLGEQEVVRWKSTDGWEIEGVMVKPVGYQLGKRYPLVMQPHGGPESADLNGWSGGYSRWGQMLAGRGFVSFYPNYRGSIGRGVAFAKADQRDLMGQEFRDMLSGIDYLVQIGVADPDRVGVGGGSYGGYTSAWAATYASQRFKAAIVFAGITDNRQARPCIFRSQSCRDRSYPLCALFPAG
jgi:dipeptidyl aminopeptidase/acylaminoacyl peptidase